MNTTLQISGYRRLRGLLLLGLLFLRLFRRPFIVSLQKLLPQGASFGRLLLADPTECLFKPWRTIGLPPSIGLDSTLEPRECDLSLRRDKISRYLLLLLLLLMLLLLKVELLLLLEMLAVNQLHLLLLLQSQLLILLQVVQLMLLLLLLLQVETIQVIGLIGTRKYWETSRIHTDFRIGTCGSTLASACSTNFLAGQSPSRPTALRFHHVTNPAVFFLYCTQTLLSHT